MARIRLWVLTGLALLLAAPGPAAAQTAHVTLLHFNDIYEIAPKAGIGGVAELTTLIEAERARAPQSLTIVSGDFLSPSILSTVTKGAHMVDLFNAMGVDMVTFGNHEFDFGPDVARERIGQSHFPWVSSNVRTSAGAPFGGAVATLTRSVGGVTIGFLGLTTPDTAHLSSPGAAVVFQPPIEAAKAAVKALKADGATVIIAVTHEDVADDRALAAAVREINVVLGGHEHDPITYYERGVLIQKSGVDGNYLGVIDLDISTRQTANGPVTRVDPSWRMIENKGQAAQPAVAALVHGYTAQLDQELGVEIGRTDTELDSRTATVRGGEAAIGDLIADALRTTLHADVGLTNGGGIRANVVRAPGTTLTRKDILAELPFGNLAVLIKLSGADLQAALENGVSEVEAKAGRFPQVSGLTVRFDPAAPAGQRIRSVLVGGQPLDPKAIYSVATNDYMAAGGDGYAVLTRGKMISDPRFAPLMATTVMDYVQARGHVAPMVEGRVAAAP